MTLSIIQSKTHVAHIGVLIHGGRRVGVMNEGARENDKGRTMNPRAAIRQHCLDCCGDRETVEKCTDYECALYAFRLGQGKDGETR